ncbi:UNVERIFIED_CONTAM: hypothetical protein K2H54_059605 [Gekko kuhli]
MAFFPSPCSDNPAAELCYGCHIHFKGLAGPFLAQHVSQLCPRTHSTTSYNLTGFHTDTWAYHTYYTFAGLALPELSIAIQVDTSRKHLKYCCIGVRGPWATVLPVLFSSAYDTLPDSRKN